MMMEEKKANQKAKTKDLKVNLFGEQAFKKKSIHSRMAEISLKLTFSILEITKNNNKITKLNSKMSM